MTNLETERFERAAQNQSLFREVNERLEDLASTYHEVAATARFACECAELSCVDQIEMSLDEYEAIRSDPNQFLVRPGHVYHEVERIVQENDRFVVVAKVGEAALIAERLDPRS